MSSPTASIETRPIVSGAPQLNQARYAELVKAAAPKVIKTQRENRLALKLIERLMEKGDGSRTREEDAILDLLSTLVEAFEKRTYPVQPGDPIETLKLLMEMNNFKAVDIAGAVGSRARASEILSGKRSISKQQAKKMGELFNVSPALFI